MKIDIKYASEVFKLDYLSIDGRPRVTREWLAQELNPAINHIMDFLSGYDDPRGSQRGIQRDDVLDAIQHDIVSSTSSGIRKRLIGRQQESDDFIISVDGKRLVTDAWLIEQFREYIDMLGHAFYSEEIYGHSGDNQEADDEDWLALIKIEVAKLAAREAKTGRMFSNANTYTSGWLGNPNTSQS